MDVQPSFSRDVLPVILVRGWGALDIQDEQRLTHQGFNIGTVYPHKTGPNYIYEGLILRFLKDRVHPYEDATNVLRYSPGAGTMIDPDNPLVERFANVWNSLWVFRYYDFEHRDLKYYGEQLAECIAYVKQVTRAPQVNIIAHSMGGLITRWMLQRVYGSKNEAHRHVNKVVTLGTPHGGINFAHFADILPVGFELKYFSRNWLNKHLGGTRKKWSDISESFDPAGMLCVIGTNRWSYAVGSKYLTGKRSDGLVQQNNAKVDGAYTAYVHKCHGGRDSLVTSREAYELATRFLFGDNLVTITRVNGRILGKYELFGSPEFYTGHSVKPRGVDFFLNQQCKACENCEGAFRKNKLPAGRVVYRGFLDSAKIVAAAAEQDIAFRFDIYIGERDILGQIGFSDTIVLDQQCVFKYEIDGQTLSLYPYMQSAGGELGDVAEPDIIKRKAKQIGPARYEFGPFNVKYRTYEAEYVVHVENVGD